MIEADEGGVRDDAQALLAAIVGMRPPADIGEQAGGVPESPLAPRFQGSPTVSTKRSVQALQLLAVARASGSAGG